MIDQPKFDAISAQAGLAGAVGLVSRGGETRCLATGHASIAEQKPMQINAIFQIASMTKALTSVAALQLVEQGRLSLDKPLGEVLPELDRIPVLEGFDGDQPRLRPAASRITLRQLLTHTAGFGYFFADEALLRYNAAHPVPPFSRAALIRPLLADPGTCWIYGTSTDWVGLAVEAASGMTLGALLAKTITEPLGMADTGFAPSDPARLATLYARDAVGELEEMQGFFVGGGDAAEIESGGGGLFSTAPDYARFLAEIGSGGGQLLTPASVDLLVRDAVEPLAAGRMGSAMSSFALPFEPFPDQQCGWSLGFLINPQAGPNGRAAGSLSWAGIANCHYWIDPVNDVTGVFLTQVLPFADPRASAAFGAFERMAYGLE